MSLVWSDVKFCRQNSKFTEFSTVMIAKKTVKKYKEAYIETTKPTNSCIDTFCLQTVPTDFSTVIIKNLYDQKRIYLIFVLCITFNLVQVLSPLYNVKYSSL